MSPTRSTGQPRQSAPDGSRPGRRGQACPAGRHASGERQRGGGDPGKRRIRGERGDGRPSSRQAVHALSETATGLGELTGLIHAAGVSPSQASPSTILKVDLYGAEVNGSGDGG